MHLLLIVVPVVFAAVCLALPSPRLRLAGLVGGERVAFRGDDLELVYDLSK